MLATPYLQRVKRKYTKYTKKYGTFSAIAKLAVFIGKDILNHVLITLIHTSSTNHFGGKKNILFLEPIQQGYGDLIFQTPIFEALHAAGYTITALIQERHHPILDRNPHIQKVYYWESPSSVSALKSHSFSHVIFLGRDTLKETLLGLRIKGANKLMLDKDLNGWRSAFSINHTLAWQKLVNKFFGNTLKFPEPKIYVRTVRSVENKKRPDIAVIVGIESEEKRYPKILELVRWLAEEYSDSRIYLLGKCSTQTELPANIPLRENVINLINKQTYLETIDLISKMDLVIGTEGSLVHVSTTMGVPTVILEIHDIFWKYSNLDKIRPIRALSGNSSPVEVLSVIKKLLQLHK